MEKAKSNKKKYGLLKDIAKNKFSYIIALPAMIYVFIFSYCSYPYMLVAFQKFRYNKSNILDIIFNGKWVGFKNFEFFFKSKYAFSVTFNTIYLNLLFIITGTIAAVLIALGLNELRCKWF
ncbi:MAG TPA: sugar ABC transporter permease, partial [Clostridiaceae bacterium]|nr:sugar ABC transporter permease [Clostridiaceae bacterium]